MLPVHPSITRRPQLRRAPDVRVFSREGGLFELEAHVIAAKSHEVPLTGMSPMKGFSQSERQRCSVASGHTSLTGRGPVQLAAFIQAVSGTCNSAGGGQPSLHLDRSHAQNRDGATVAEFYPRWQLATPASTSTVS